MKPYLILASQSPYRKAQLEQMGCHFEVRASGFDESSISREGMSPSELCLLLAQKKAEAVRALGVPENAFIISSDQMVIVEDEILGKPGNIETALRQLKTMQGKSHDLMTSLVVDAGSQKKFYVDRTRLKMRPLTDEQILQYLQLDEPFDCAGSYKLERAGISLFESIESQDFTAIQGLPLLTLTRFLVELGANLPFQIRE